MAGGSDRDAGCPPRASEYAITGHAALVIGHGRWAGYRPEHTLAPYELATRLGADFIEPT